eukprot:gene18123-22915_t
MIRRCPGGWCSICASPAASTHQAISMTQDSFEDACDRLSQGIDAVQFERLRWSKTEGPMLARLVELVHLAIAD